MNMTMQPTNTMHWLELPSGQYLNLAAVAQVCPRRDGLRVIFLDSDGTTFTGADAQAVVDAIRAWTRLHP